VPITVEITPDHVATVEFDNPPNNFFNVDLLGELADTYERLDDDPACRAIVLAAAGRHFCAGADFGGGKTLSVREVYGNAVRLFAARTPVVAAVQGAAVGGGLGLALSADFRVATESTRFVANFAKLGIHHGFGLTITLPRIVGTQRAQDLLLTSRPVRGEEALEMQLCDRLVEAEHLRHTAQELAAEIAAAAPLAVRSIRGTMRGDLAERVREATEREADEQTTLFQTDDFAEGVAATSERRSPNFSGR
jgi:2-(1,2-epoxy-1,2-dihydrophenyl)acetyl-CoA isomerase